jgi:hypothetical protein
MKRILHSGILAAAVFAVALDTARAQSNVYALNVVAGLQLYIPKENYSLLVGPESRRFGVRAELTYPIQQVGDGPQLKGRYTSFTLDFVCESVDSGGTITNATRLAAFSRDPFRLSLNPWCAAPIFLLISARLWVMAFGRPQKLRPPMPMAGS